MRVLFLESGLVWIYGLPNGFRDAGHEVEISGSLSEIKLVRLLKEFQPNLIISIGWTKENSVQKQLWIRKHVGPSGIPLAYWAVEDPAFTQEWSLPLIKRMRPDFVFSISPVTIELYEKLGIPSAHMDFGIHSSVHSPVEPEKQYQTNLAIVASAYPEVLKKYPHHYRHTSLKSLVDPILKTNSRIDFWGYSWDQMSSYFGYTIPKDWIHGYLPYTEANKVYSSANIMIGPQNYPEQVTQRTYEILASGGFLLTSDTPGVRELFVPGRDLIVSSNSFETLELIEHFLQHTEEKERIRKQSTQAVASHTYRHRAEYMVNVLKLRGFLPSVKPKTTYYTVKKGDTLWGISRTYGLTVDYVKELNGLVSSVIYPGQILKL